MKKLYSALLALAAGLSVTAQAPQLHLVQFATGFTKCLDIKNCGDDRIFVVEQGGKIKITDKNGNVRSTPFLNITSRVYSGASEQGLLSLAFSPNYKQDSSFYVNYTKLSGTGTVISRFKVSAADSNVADPASERILLTFSEPYNNHQGATLMFGHDGYLYDTQGDGGSETDPLGNGQKTNTLLSKMLRLDVSNPDSGYAVPPTNPFVGNSAYKPELWAIGLRNAWRCSIDRLTGDLWMGDVGQDTYEEVDFQPAASAGGQNYGWRCREGFHACPNCDTTGCPSTGFTDPIFEYAQSTLNGCAVMGGYVYRGAQFANMFGRYFLVDYCSGRFWDISQPGPGAFQADTLVSYSSNAFVSFGEDNTGELYVADNVLGRIYHLTETSSCKPVAFISFQDTITGSGCIAVTLSALAGDTLSYQWYDINGQISGATSAQYEAAQSGWYKVKVSKVQAGCSSMSDSVYAVVHQPDALLPCNCSPIFCSDRSPFSLSYFFSPAGGIYSGNAVSNDSVFNPAVAGVGTDTILYTYTNMYNCVSRDTFALQVTICLGISGIDENFAFSVFPNPFNTSAVITTNVELNNASLKIFDLTGRLLRLTENMNGRKLNIERKELPEGMYFFELDEAGKIIAKGKLIVE